MPRIERVEAQNHARDLGYALDEARSRLAAAIKAADDAEADRILRDAKVTASECIAHAQTFDELTTAASAEVEAVLNCRQRLAKTKTLEMTYLNDLAAKPVIQRAVAMTGLAKLFDHAGTSARQPLAKSFSHLDTPSHHKPFCIASRLNKISAPTCCCSANVVH
jgi:cell division septum initiation protein DivIVA